MTIEEKRLQESPRIRWKKWGPYLSERQWGTVREDYSERGDAWNYLPHDHARSRAYRWGEDGLLGISDHRQRLCFCMALWNGRDAKLKERLFGLSGSQGNHGEDVKEVYYYLDSTPTHSYMKALYKYPQAPFPYDALLEAGRNRSRREPELDLIETGVFDDDRYFDVFIEYAKASPEDLLIRIRAHNRGPDEALLHAIPQAFFRNTWSWGHDPSRPEIRTVGAASAELSHGTLGQYLLSCDGAPEPLLTENETNMRRLYGARGADGPFKDAFHEAIVHGHRRALARSRRGTKVGFHQVLRIPAGEARTVRLRLSRSATAGSPFEGFDEVFERRIEEADAYYAHLQHDIRDADARRVQRQALSGMLWSKQFYAYSVDHWLDGDPGQPPPPARRRAGRNNEWRHLNNADIISMPDKWEYPWYAAWDLAFHCIPLAMVDPEFAKRQLVLLTREWYMHPNGQLPAYEWSLGDVNPPVHAWAAWRVYKMDRARRGGTGDLPFLERMLHKLMLNFTWWVNRKDAHGRNLFQGGFLGLDNIGVFDRSAPLPSGGHLEQADGTSWMAMYSLNLMRISLELAQHNSAYEDLASKFFEHFLYIAGAMNNVGGEGIGLWDEEDEFFYDVMHWTENGREHSQSLKIRSMVGLIPLFAVDTIEPELLERLPGFKRRMEWFLKNRPELANLISRWQEPGAGERRLLSLLRGHRMKCLLRRLLDESEFLSDYGVRALSRHHLEHPFVLRFGDVEHRVGYQPAESDSPMFGGNSNWRGPIWFPMNFLIIESLQKFHHYYGDDFKVECPTGSGHYLTIEKVAEELSRRLNRIFLRDASGRRAGLGPWDKFQNDPHFRDHVLFYEYFNGDNGAGLGASHQTGWTGLVAKLLQPRRPDTASREVVGRTRSAEPTGKPVA